MEPEREAGGSGSRAAPPGGGSPDGDAGRASRADGGTGGDGDARPGDDRGVDRLRLLALLGGGVLVLDQATKWWVVHNLSLHEVVPVWGDFLRLTYTHNYGAAFGIDVGVYSRPFFLTLALLALGVLLYLFVQTPRGRELRLWALALVSGGAVGNVVDRIRYDAGVVDFLDVGVGSLRWPVFNVADMAVSVGAILLVITFYRDETRPRPSGESPAPDADPDRGGGEVGGRRREGGSDGTVVAGEA